MASVDPRQPVVILGGFLITGESYKPMADWLIEHGAIDAEVVLVSRYDWLLTSWGFGWRRVLDRVDEVVRRLQAKAPLGHITLIGHSSGGVMRRLYLSSQLFQARSYAGASRCDRLISLGSPHQAVRATSMRAMVDRCFAGCCVPGLDRITIDSMLDLESANASSFSRCRPKGTVPS